MNTLEELHKARAEISRLRLRLEDMLAELELALARGKLAQAAIDEREIELTALKLSLARERLDQKTKENTNATKRRHRKRPK